MRREASYSHNKKAETGHKLHVRGAPWKASTANHTGHTHKTDAQIKHRMSNVATYKLPLSTSKTYCLVGR